MSGPETGFDPEDEASDCRVESAAGVLPWGAAVLDAGTGAFELEEVSGSASESGLVGFSAGVSDWGSGEALREVSETGSEETVRGFSESDGRSVSGDCGRSSCGEDSSGDGVGSTDELSSGMDESSG